MFESRGLRLGAAMLVVCACSGTPMSTDGGTGGGAAGGAGAGGQGGGGGVAGGSSTGGGGQVSTARTSRSSTLAFSGTRLFVVNPDVPGLVIDGRVAVALPQGSQPWAVAISPGATRAYVALRKTQQLAAIGDLDSTPRVLWSAAVCSEPTGVALSPSGRTAVVACFGEPAAVLVDTETQAVTRIALPDVARSVAVTNDGDGDDADERAYVTLFYGQLVAEGSDTGRVGRVVEIDLGARIVATTLTLQPVTNTGFGAPLPDGGEGAPVGCAPNQLASIAIAGDRAFVVHTCASPQPPLNRLTTLFSGFSVLSLTSRSELQSVILGKLVREQGGAGESLLGLPVDVDVDPAGGNAVVLSQAANRVATLSVERGQSVHLVIVDGGTSTPVGCAYGSCGGGPGSGGVPIGITRRDDGVVFANDWNGRTVQPVAFFTTLPPYSAPPTPGTLEAQRLLGRFFFYTGQNRWSHRDVGSCASCHPDGLSDNVTWVFPAGPRQTPSLDGTFAKGDPADHRVQNWTGVFDEIYDVEGVTRNVLGGLGAITWRDAGTERPLSLTAGMTFDGGWVTRSDGLSGSSKAISDEYSAVKDWTELDLFSQDVHANRAPTGLDAAAVARGRTAFETAGCAHCHGGAKWTVSRIPYVPSPEKNGSAVGDNGLPAAATGLRTEARDGGAHASNRDTLKVAPERLPNPDGGATIVVGPERITCAVRDVGTFDEADPLEKKADGTRAQGAMGFNPPSLFGLATSAPYFHNGAAKTLDDVFTARFATHLQSGNPVSLTGAQIADLIVFLRSIDESTAPFPASSTVDICGGY